MSQYVESACRTFQAGAAIAQYLRVALSTGKLAAAGADTLELGTMDRPSFADLDMVAVRLRTAQGTVKMVANAAITQGAKVYAAAAGKIASTGTILIGEALEAAGADNDVIEVLRSARGGLGVGGVTAVAAAGNAQANATALSAGLNSVSAADGTKGVVLPAAVAGGEPVYVYNEHASNGLKVYPASGDDINDGTTDAAITTEGKTLATFIPLDATTWVSQYTANS